MTVALMQPVNSDRVTEKKQSQSQSISNASTAKQKCHTGLVLTHQHKQGPCTELLLCTSKAFQQNSRGSVLSIVQSLCQPQSPHTAHAQLPWRCKQMRQSGCLKDHITITGSECDTPHRWARCTGGSVEQIHLESESIYCLGVSSQRTTETRVACAT